MAWNSDRAAAVTAAIVTILAGPARADECDSPTTLSLLDAHYGLAPPADDRLGLDLRVRGLIIGWGRGCDVRRHQVELSDAENAEYGNSDQVVARLVTYRHGWQGRGWTAHVGVRAAVYWGDHWRYATPVVGGSLRLGQTLLRGELELGGLSLADPGDLDVRVARRRTDLALDASAVWPDQSTTRAEVRLRVRDLAMTDPADDVHDVTVTAGVGVAMAARDHLRALPGFAGLAVKDGDERTVLAVLEWSLGVSP